MKMQNAENIASEAVTSESVVADSAIRSPQSAFLAEVRARLNGERGQHYWRSLEEIAETKEFQELLHREFPAGASEWWDGLSRRNFLKMAAATLALAGMSACTKQPTREIYPYVKQPEELVPGEPLFYATSMLLGGYATGVLVKSREGHPIKVDGNPEHPSSLGGSSVWMQTSILDLYDPDRSQSVTHEGDISTWALFLSELNDLVRERSANEGAGLRLLTETVTSPTLAAQVEDLLKRFPQAKWHQYDPLTRDNVRQGARLAFGENAEAHYQFEKAAVILALDADFLYTHPERLRYTRHFTDGRRVTEGKKEMNRLYVVESTPTITGTMAEHRLPLESKAVEELARLVAQQLGAEGQVAGKPLSPEQVHWVSALVKDLQQHRGASIVIAGEWQPPSVHALAHWLNQTLGNVGKTVHYTEPAEAQPMQQLQSLRQLVEEMKAGEVESLFILGGNPAYTAPADLEFVQALQKVNRSIHLGLYLDETAALCTWHIPQAHYLEAWGDSRAFDGTVSLMQPLIAPLYGGKTACEVLGAMVQQQPVRSDYELVRDFWRGQKLWPDFDLSWRKALHDGLIPGTATRPKQVQCRTDFLQAPVPPGDSAASGVVAEPAPNPKREEAGSRLLGGAPRTFQSLSGTIEVNFRPDPNLWDGRFANNGWLQECPKPVSKLTWDNAILVSPVLAQLGGLGNGDVVELSMAGRTVRGPVWVMPGQAPNAVTLHLGYGRSRAGRVGAGVGFNAYAVRSSDAFWFGQGAKLTPTGQKHQLVATQTHHNLHSPDREVYRSGTLAEYLANADFVKQTVEEPKKDETLYYPNEYKYDGYKWGMSIDLTTCIGCNACLVACEVENNIPVVGKDQVFRNREMFWIRVDTYYKGSLDNPEFNHMPVPCMHCEHAPCELVCPVEATVHDHEGLNLQVYNRCVGTRFCSNNCPYKVRRFNFLRYTDYHTPSYKPMYNPEVTVRWRGVMEKCTYCIQRISAARITAEKQDRRIREGEVQTACQQACPAEAIIFGDLNAPDSKVARLKAHPLDYSMLGQLNTRPRTTYTAKLQNRNPALEKEPPV
jgi:MoCo/4Fe-4S cofactor protein with predicted Tat translocation signal